MPGKSVSSSRVFGSHPPLLNMINPSQVAEDPNALLDEIFQWSRLEGFVSGTEQYEICARALKFRNFSYRRSEELEAGTTVDCSTLVSQAYWEGAVIGVPFVADNQRTASTGITIQSLAEMVPGDVLVKYESLEMSPDKTWNHVGLYLGKAALGAQWLIESTSKTGVTFSRVPDFGPKGGIKRFTLSRRTFSSEAARVALKLAAHVPKFGRLGVRQYTRTESMRVPHRGLD